MTIDDFDPSVLRRLDRPRRPSPTSTDRIRAAMLATFDEAATPPTQSDVPDDPTDRRAIEVSDDDPTVHDEPAHVIELRTRANGSPGTTDDHADGRRWRDGHVARSIAVAAALVALVAGLVALRQTDDPVTLDETATSDVDTVVTFCLDGVDPLVDDLENFLVQPGGELSDRAVRNSELLAQRYRDLAPLLSEPLATRVAANGDDLLDRAAAARSLLMRREDEAVIVELIGATVAAIDELPGSGWCRLEQLREAMP